VRKSPKFGLLDKSLVIKRLGISTSKLRFSDFAIRPLSRCDRASIAMPKSLYRNAKAPFPQRDRGPIAVPRGLADVFGRSKQVFDKDFGLVSSLFGGFCLTQNCSVVWCLISKTPHSYAASQGGCSLTVFNHLLISKSVHLFFIRIQSGSFSYNFRCSLSFPSACRWCSVGYWTPLSGIMELSNEVLPFGNVMESPFL
jgi:hypothetical protein